jgi:hypothetical protein
VLWNLGVYDATVTREIGVFVLFSCAASVEVVEA